MKIKHLVFPLVITLTPCLGKITVEHTLTEPTMVHIMPDSTVLDELWHQWGEEDAAVIMDDIVWYHSELMMVVDSMGMDQITTEIKNLRLTGGEKTWQIDMDTTNQKWRYIYFDGKDFVEKDAIDMKDYLIQNN